MNGWLKKRDDRTRPNTWSIILDLGPKVSQTGKKGRKQKWITFHGSEKDAKRKLRELLGDGDRGEFIEPSKRTVAAWLDEWLEKAVRLRLSPRTYTSYENAIRTYLKPRLGHIPLQQLTPTEIEYYHRELRQELRLSSSTCQLHHIVLSSSLALAVRDGLVRRNVASLASCPSRHRERDGAQAWTVEEARSVLAAAKSAGAQVAALFAVALDSGARKGELQGLRWSDLDLKACSMRIERQLLKAGAKPVFSETKTRRIRSLDLSAETVAQLREHKRVQSELKLAHRPDYADHDLVFACCGQRATTFGTPLSAHTIAAAMDRLRRATGVRRITVHGLRHTSATLLLAAGVQPHVVQQRLGHGPVAPSSRPR